MKKIWVLLFVSLFAQQCFGETKSDSFSPVPPWVKRSDSIHEHFKWSSFNQQKVFFDSRRAENGGMLRIPEYKSRVTLLFFKEEDRRFGAVPTINDKYKDSVLPLPDDFNPFNRSLLRLRPSFLLGNDWRVTIPRVHKNEGKILFRKDGNFF